MHVLLKFILYLLVYTTHASGSTGLAHLVRLPSAQKFSHSSLPFSWFLLPALNPYCVTFTLIKDLSWSLNLQDVFVMFLLFQVNCLQ